MQPSTKVLGYYHLVPTGQVGCVVGSLAGNTQSSSRRDATTIAHRFIGGIASMTTHQCAPHHPRRKT
jgi:hypothetical protein